MSHKPLTYFTAVSLAAHAAVIGFWPSTTQVEPGVTDRVIEIGLVSLPRVSSDFVEDFAPPQQPTDSISPRPAGATISSIHPAKSIQPPQQLPASQSRTTVMLSESASQDWQFWPSLPARPQLSNRSTRPSANPVTATRAAPVASANQPPTYPAAALRNGWEGEVWLRVSITRSGAVGEVIIEQSSDYTILDQAAIKTVRRWRFEPARIGDQTTEGSVQIPIRFQIRRS